MDPPGVVTLQPSAHGEDEIINGSALPRPLYRSLRGVTVHRGMGLIMPCQEVHLATPLLFSWLSGSLFCVHVCGGLSLCNWAQTMSHSRSLTHTASSRTQ